MKKKKTLTTKILFALILGLIVGIILNLTLSLLAPENTISTFISSYIIQGLFSVIGKIFINAIRMLVVPLVLISLIVGVANIGDVNKLGRVGGTSLIFYLMTTAIAVALAITIGTLIQPGHGLSLTSQASKVAIGDAPSIGSIIVSFFPANPFNAMASGNMLQVICFSILTGVSFAFLGDKVKNLASLMNEINDVIMKMISIIMHFAPIGVFGLVAKVFSEQGIEAILPLIKYMFAVALALLIHVTIFYGGFLKLLSGLSPRIFFKKFYPTMLVAFSTSSSNATIPASISNLEHKMGVSNNIASFTIPFGATINMDGTAIMQGVAVVFISQIYGIPLSITDYLMVIFTATLASIGTAGVPGVGLITLSMVLTQVKLPVEGIAIIMGVDRILDMLRTAVNVTGDAVVTLIVSKKENELNEKIFNDMNVPEEDE